MVFQHFGLFPHMTVLDNVAYPLRVQGVKKSDRHAKARKVIELVGLEGREHHFPRELSGGQRQRVGIARALVDDCWVWFLDEPFSALDPLIRRQLQDKFMSLSAEMKKTTLFITHDLDEAIRIGDRIAIMKDGALVQVGTPEDIVTNPVDEYVADFVAGISKLELVSAGKIMEPLAAYEKRAGPVDHELWPEAHPEHSLDDLVNLSIATQHPVMVKVDGKPIGVVTKNALLRGIQGDLDDPASVKH
jgi:glycine betaine/proline transport system ATP-binding protein